MEEVEGSNPLIAHQHSNFLDVFRAPPCSGGTYFCRCARHFLTVSGVSLPMIECIFTIDYEIYGNGEGSLEGFGF